MIPLHIALKTIMNESNTYNWIPIPHYKRGALSFCSLRIYAKRFVKSSTCYSKDKKIWKKIFISFQ